MGCYKLTVAWFILAIFLNQESQFVKGRQLKLGKTKEFQQFHIHENAKETTNHINILDHQPNRAANAIELLSQAPTQVHDDLQTSPGPPLPHDYLDDFRPTTPGRSPGAGHSIHN
ncbi:unnamed protein product [Amaranthus hypochondriacus]